MRDQQGYIELSGTAVSAAAELAHAKHLEEDEKVNVVRRVKREDARKREEYFIGGQADRDFLGVVNSAKVETTKIVEKQGWFCKIKEEVKRTQVDINKLRTLLIEVNPIWETSEHLEGMVNDYKYYHRPSCIQEVAYSMSLHWAYGEVDTASYFLQFFDLKGVVYLTLEQYQRLKEFM